MKNALFLFVVTWRLFVQINGESDYMKYNRSAEFVTKNEARKFMKLAPSGEFECVDEYTGKPARCKVVHFTMVEK